MVYRSTLRDYSAYVGAILVLLPYLAGSSPTRNLVYFHSNVPSNLFVNAAHGPTHIKNSPDNKTDIIQLVLYPTDKKSRASKFARAVILQGKVRGTFSFRQVNPPVGPVDVTGRVKGLLPMNYTIQVTEFGDISDGCKSVGEAYNPYDTEILNQDGKLSVGDLGTLRANQSGEAVINVTDSFITLVGPRSIIGRSFLIAPLANSDQDEFNSEIVSVKTCGVIGYAEEI